MLILQVPPSVLKRANRTYNIGAPPVAHIGQRVDPSETDKADQIHLLVFIRRSENQLGKRIFAEV